MKLLLTAAMTLVIGVVAVWGIYLAVANVMPEPDFEERAWCDAYMMGVVHGVHVLDSLFGLDVGNPTQQEHYTNVNACVHRYSDLIVEIENFEWSTNEPVPNS